MFNSNIIQQAIKVACKSDVIRGKIGAVLFTDSGHILTSSYNSTFWGSTRIKTVHAEEALLQKAWKLKVTERYGKKLNILVVRWVIGTRRLTMAKPCINCQKSLAKTSFNVYYTNESGCIERMES